MRLIDLSQPMYDGSPNCPTHPPVKSELIADHPKDGWRVELLTLANHTGSHIDAPLHKLADGISVDQFPLESFVGKAHIADLRSVCRANEPITREQLSQRLPAELKDRIVLLATGWGDKRAKTKEWLWEPPYLSNDAAKFLVEKGIRGVGIDHYSVAGIGEHNPTTHTILLGSKIWILEELRFPAEVFTLPQPLQLWCLPINLRFHSGSFTRPVIVVED